MKTKDIRTEVTVMATKFVLHEGKIIWRIFKNVLLEYAEQRLAEEVSKQYSKRTNKPDLKAVPRKEKYSL